MDFVEQIENKLTEGLKEALCRVLAQNSVALNELPSFIVEVPRDPSHGDFASNAALLLAGKIKNNPRELAQAIAQNFPSLEEVERIEVAGPGFINFRLKSFWLDGVVPNILTEKENYGRSDIGKRKKVQVEFVSANPTGLLHMGNARGAALGDTIASLLETAGFAVTREFYINDAGSQIENFGRSLEARYLQFFGRDVPLPDDGYQGEDLILTVKNFIELNGDYYLDQPAGVRQEALIEFALKEKIEAIRKSLERFGVFFDVWFSEKTLHQTGEIGRTIEELTQKGFVYEKDGAVWFKATLLGEEKDEVLVRQNGFHTYFAADIAYHRNKFQRGFECLIDIWGADHHGHVARLKKALKALGYEEEALTVILMQLVRLFSGGEILRMSKRTGQYVTLDELLDEVGKDAARYFFLERSADAPLDFDLDLAKAQSQENPVYYVQYAHARISSILRLAKEEDVPVPQADYALLSTSYETELIRKLADFPGLVKGAALALEPHRLPAYTQKLAALFHVFYTNCRVLNEDPALRRARLDLCWAVKIVLQNLLKIMGVSAPEQM